MPRLARVTMPGLSYHVTQRGNRRQETFFLKSDYELYLELVGKWTRMCDVAVDAYCLMPNHIHFEVSPSTSDGMVRAFAETHRRYTQIINQRMGWRGCLWQGRFFSCPLGEQHRFLAARYIEMNPVRAGLVDHPSEWRWSSARAHLSGRDDGIVTAERLGAQVDDWASFLGLPVSEQDLVTVRRHARGGLPLGDETFIQRLENLEGRVLRPAPIGRPRKQPEQGDTETPSRSEVA